MNLVIDIGNTLSKVFVFEKNKIIYSHQFNQDFFINELEIIFSKNQKIKKSIISSVQGIDSKHVDYLKDKVNNFIYLNKKTKLPIINLYESPDTLGKDRLAAIIGANNIFKNQDVLVIDAGTAITFDFINKNNEYIGGNISPGLEMRYKSLNLFTSKLPLIKKDEKFNLIGKNTKEAIISGVQNGLVFEIDSYINIFKEKFNNIKIILTGGDSFFFEHKLKNCIFAEVFLIAIGLNKILIYNT